MTVAAGARTVLTRTALWQLLLGWGAFVTLLATRSLWDAELPTVALFTLLGAIVAVIVVCASGVVAQAEHLARRLGDPYGTLVLTLSIVVIEVILISAVMLGPGEHATIGRDSVMAVTMIVLNLVIGIALLVGGIRHGALEPNRAGVSSYLSMLVVLLATAFALPGLIGVDGAYTTAQAVPILTLTIVLYGFFLHRQTGAQRGDFQEVVATSLVPSTTPATGPSPARPHVMEVLRTHRTEVLARAAVLVLTVVPIVLLSHDMARLLDDAVARVGAPSAVSGILIAMIVFLPETITTIRAASTGEIQRVSNLCHGGLVSTVGLTIPAVLTIGLLTGQPVTLAESPANLVLLGVSVLLTFTSFLGRQVTALHGGAHVMAFALYAVVVFS